MWPADAPIMLEPFKKALATFPMGTALGWDSIRLVVHNNAKHPLL